jgi:hypothetical protein
MSFTRAQQPAWQGMIRAAWKAHCLREGLTSAPGQFDRGWYERELSFATGRTSTIECNAGRDYDFAMAHFEALAGSGIRWQMCAHTGDARRLLHELSRFSHTHHLDEDYLRKVARQMLRTPHLPHLAELTRAQLLVILGEVKRHLHRRTKRDGASS